MDVAQEYLNAWGAKKFGKPGKYTIEMSAGYTYYSTLTGGESYMEVSICCDGKEVACDEGADFHEMLNDILAANMEPPK